jgi:hypothetical protein
VHRPGGPSFFRPFLCYEVRCSTYGSP